MSFFQDVINIVAKYYPQLLSGVGNTMLIALTGTVAGLAIGLLTGIVRTAPFSRNGFVRVLHKILNAVIAVYVEIFRGTPMMVQALLRRTYEFGAAAPVLEHAGAILNTGDNTLTYADEHIALTKNEYRILLTLMQNKGKIVSREKLMEALWQTDSFVDENTLTVNVGRLRKKLENAGLHDFITTKFGVGYAVGEK